MKPVYFDSHMHTPLCKHAEGQPEEYAAVAVQRGLKGITFTCHSPMPAGWWPRVRMDESQLDEYCQMVERAALAYAGKLEIRLGMETDYFPGMENWAEKLNERLDLHHVLGSVHFFGPEYMERYWNGDLLGFQKQYFRHVADSAETGLFDTLAHPDLVKNHHPEGYDFEALQDTIEECLDRIAKTRVAMEYNTSGLNKRYPEANPGPKMLALMHARGIPVVIGSDSHTPRRVGADFLFACQELEQAGYSRVSYFQNRKRFEVNISDVIACIDKALVEV